MQVHSIDNFRDVGESISALGSKRVCPHILFRSATLDGAAEEDLKMLVDEIQIKTVLDLRSELEAKMAKLAEPFSTFPITANLKLDPSDILDPNPRPDMKIITEVKLPNRDGTSPSRKTFMVNFAGTKFRKYAVWWPAPLWAKLRIVYLVLSGQKLSAAKLAGTEVINKKGLDGLYRDFIDYCDAEICESLHVLSDPANYPILVHCTHGKDRTGIVIALALAAIGVEEEYIFQDYAKSTHGLERVRPRIIEELSNNGLDPCFAETPEATMRATFEYIKTKYGSINEYLCAVGFDDKSRELLKMVLLSDEHT